MSSDTPLNMIAFETLHSKNQTLHDRYLGAQKSAIYLIRPINILRHVGQNLTPQPSKALYLPLWDMST